MHDHFIQRSLYNLKFIKKAIIGVCITSILIFILTIPAIIKPLYESETIVFVPLTILTQQLNQQGIGFASGPEIDGYIQILKSHNLMDSLISRYSLDSSYHINLEEQGAKSRLYAKIESLINIQKTRYNSVSVKVRNANPEKAANMSNAIIQLGDIIKEKMLYPNRLEALKYSKSLYEQKQEEVHRLEHRMDSIEKMRHVFESKENIVADKLLTQYQLALQQLVTLKSQFEREQKNFETPLPKAYIISPAIAVLKPAWPPRAIFMVAGNILYVFVLIIIEIFLHDFKGNRYQE